MTEMLMPRNYLEIPEPRIPGVFLELAEEARNVSSLCDRPITNTVTTGDGRDSLDPNDMEYWNPNSAA